MANDTITFLCPACGIKLTVPGTLAGVTGPCPSCRNSIQAPFPSPPPAPPVQPAAPAYQQPGSPPSQPATPAYQQPGPPPSQPDAPAYHTIKRMFGVQGPTPSQPAAPAYQQPAQPAPPVYQQPATPPPGQAAASSSQPAYQQPTPPPSGYTATPSLSQPAPAPPVYQQPATPPRDYAAATPSQPVYQQPTPPSSGYIATPPLSQPAPPVYQQPATPPPGYAAVAPSQPVPSDYQQPTGPTPSGYGQQPVQYPASAPAHQPQPAAAPTAYEPPPLPPQVIGQQAPPVVLTPESPGASPALVRPEPRQLPNRSNHEPVGKQMPEPSPRGNHSKKGNPLPRHPRRKGPFARFLMLFAFLFASVALVFGVLTVLNSKPEGPPPRQAQQGMATAPSVPVTPPAGRSPESTEPKPPVLPVPTPEQPVIVEPPPELPEGMEPITPASEAREVLDKFLAAKTLEERLPIIETKTARAELEASCLARPLPSADKIYIDGRENNPTEQVSDFYHTIDFIGENNQIQPHIILVRIRGGAPPKVVVDPFLDSYGGRLAAYAKAPGDRAGVFQIIVSALASCYNQDVPNREKKLTLKLLPRDNEKAIAEAYFGRQSEIGRMLEEVGSDNYRLRYGMAKACTVMLRWNKEDNPEKPYLEAIDLISQDWNP